MGVTMPLNSDISNALLMLEHIQSTINQSDDEKLQSQATEDLNLIISLLDNPMFRGVAAVQDSLNVLSSQIQQHPSILPVDFDITESGELELNLPPPLYEGDFIATPNNELDDQRVPVAKLSQSSSGETVSPPIITPNIDEIPLTPITNTTYALEFQKAIDESSQGRDVITVKLFKPEGCSLGFSVVGLRSEEKGELGIFIQEIQPTGIAGRDGGLHEGDQILAIDGQPLDSNISHQQAISILQKARGLVELIVARSEDQEQEQGQPHSPGPSSPISSPSPSLALSETSKAGSDMVLNTEWAQVEVIDLINDGSGLGFGIIGGRSTGVVVKTILHGGVADRDGRLQSGDHILQIGEVNLRGMGSEQVASVLRQSGSHVRLVVARPVEPTSPDYQALPSHAPIVPTKILADPEELDRHLVQNGYPQVTYNPATPGGEPYHNPFIIHQDPSDLPLEPETRIVLDMLPGLAPSLPLPLLTMDMIPLDTQLPEMERFTVELKKDSQGLGITIAGYVCEKEELSGIFVKSISPGSAADLCKMIQVNDRIVEVDEKSLQGYTNHDAVEVLRATGGTVCLSLERYLRGPKFEQLQQAIANSELKPPIPSSPSALSLPRFPINVDGESTEIDAEGESVTTVDSVVFHEACNPDVEFNDNELLIDKDYEGPLKPSVEAAIKEKWSKIMGPDVEIVVGQLRKFGENKGLGISLEGTVDVEDGQEVRPHHYIRSILPEGPVGQNGRLRSGDELLEVNGHRLLGMNHIEVVTILKELPLAVRMVCARRSGEGAALRLIDTSQDRAAFAARSILGGSLQNLLPAMERLVKAKSDGSLASITTATTEPSLSKLRSRSLEPITGLAMWSSEPHIIELVKGERGLGFSILDYQDPMNPSETVIVIRSLVPGGVAQMDGRLIPGDRLLSVNSVALDNASLDQAVQALKGAPKGVVKIAVAKPLPIPDSVSNSQDFENSVNEETPTLDDHSMYSCSGSLHSDLEQKVEISIPELELDGDQESGIISKENILDIPLLENLEREVTIDGRAQPLGLILEDADGGENGLVVKDLEPNGALTLDGRISTGDFISSINNVTLRRVTHQQSTSILDRALGASSQISIRYIPRGEIVKFMSTLQHKPEEVQVEPTESRCRFLYPDSTASPITVSDYSTQVLSPVFSSFGCESASDKESEYLDCDWLEERTLLSSPVQTFKPESGVSPESVDSNKVQSKLQNSDNLNVQNIESTFNPLFDTSKRDSFCRKSLNISDNTIDSEKDSDYTIKKSVNYVCFSRERSLESLSKCRTNSNGINFSELSKGVSEPLLNSGNRYLKSVVSLESGREFRGKGRMTVTSTSSTVSLANHWGPQRRVRIMRDPTSSIGISIVGGKVDIYNSRPDCSSVISGVFIKNILPNSPADRTAELKTGDRILEVDGVDLRLASHERAVNVIRSAGNPVTFLVQSLVQWNPDGESISEGLATREFNEPSLGAPYTSTENVPSSFPGSKSLDSNQSSEHFGKAEERKASSSSSEESEEEDSRDLEGRTKTAAGVQISRASAGNVKRSKEEIAMDPEKEDPFGYTTNKVRKKYGAIAVMAEVTRGPNGLGISLAGHKDRTKMAVFICGLNPSIVAYTSGSLQVGDEIVEVNGIKLHGRCHLNASAIIKSLPGQIFKIIALRRSEGLDELSVKPITQFPVILKEETPEQRFSSFKGLRTVSMKKMSGQGLGIMIIEGRHTEAGQGIFISDIQEGSPADQADLHVGDMVLAVNKDSLVGSNYEAAAALLKKTEGVVTLIVCNPNKAKEKSGDEKAGTSAEPIASTSSGITASGAPLTPRSDRSGKTSQATTPKLAPPGGSMSPSPSAKLRLEEEQAISALITPGVECLIEINKDKMGLGLSIVGGSDTLLRYVIIHEIYADGAAAKDGRLKRGDVVLEVNHNDFRDITHHRALTFLRQTPAKVRMLVLREESDGKEDDDELSNYDYLEIEIVKKSGKGLGLNIVGKRAGPGIFISDVVGGGAASVDGRLMKGDQILSVNGQDITKMSHEDAAVVLKTAIGKVTLQILRFKQSDCDMQKCSSVIMLQEENGL